MSYWAWRLNYSYMIEPGGSQSAICAIGCHWPLHKLLLTQTLFFTSYCLHRHCSSQATGSIYLSKEIATTTMFLSQNPSVILFDPIEEEQSRLEFIVINLAQEAALQSGH